MHSPREQARPPGAHTACENLQESPKLQAPVAYRDIYTYI